MQDINKKPNLIQSSSNHLGEESYQAGLDAYWGRNNKPVNNEDAFLAFQKAAERQHPKGIAYLGFCYIQGYGIPQNESKGEELLQETKPALDMLAKKGDPEAQYCLGCMYDTGHGVERDNSIALKYYQDAANQHYGYSQYSLGRMYQTGRGEIKDRTKSNAEAVKWYTQATAQGNAYAKAQLETMSSSQLTAKDYSIYEYDFNAYEFNENLTPEALLSFIVGANSYRRLTIKNCHCMTQKTLTTLATHSPNLVELSLEDISFKPGDGCTNDQFNRGLLGIALRCKHLNVLRLKAIDGTSIRDPREENYAEPIVFPRLQALSVEDCLQLMVMKLDLPPTTTLHINNVPRLVHIDTHQLPDDDKEFYQTITKAVIHYFGIKNEIQRGYSPGNGPGYVHRDEILQATFLNLTVLDIATAVASRCDEAIWKRWWGTGERVDSFMVESRQRLKSSAALPGTDEPLRLSRRSSVGLAWAIAMRFDQDTFVSFWKQVPSELRVAFASKQNAVGDTVGHWVAKRFDSRVLRFFWDSLKQAALAEKSALHNELAMLQNTTGKSLAYVVFTNHGSSICLHVWHSLTAETKKRLIVQPVPTPEGSLPLYGLMLQRLPDDFFKHDYWCQLDVEAKKVVLRATNEKGLGLFQYACLYLETDALSDWMEALGDLDFSPQEWHDLLYETKDSAGWCVLDWVAAYHPMAEVHLFNLLPSKAVSKWRANKKQRPEKDLLGNAEAHRLAWQNACDDLQKLCKHHSLKKIKNKDGQTIAHAAASRGSLATLRWIAITYPTLLNQADHSGATPLTLMLDAADRQGTASLLEPLNFLLSQHVNVTEQDKESLLRQGYTFTQHADKSSLCLSPVAVADMTIDNDENDVEEEKYTTDVVSAAPTNDHVATSNALTNSAFMISVHQKTPIQSVDIEEEESKALPPDAVRRLREGNDEPLPDKSKPSSNQDMALQSSGIDHHRSSDEVDTSLSNPLRNDSNNKPTNEFLLAAEFGLLDGMWLNRDEVDYHALDGYGDHALTLALRSSLTSPIKTMKCIKGATLKEFSPNTAWLIQHTDLRLTAHENHRLLQQLSEVKQLIPLANQLKDTLIQSPNLIDDFNHVVDKQSLELRLFYCQIDAKSIKTVIATWQEKQPIHFQRIRLRGLRPQDRYPFKLLLEYWQKVDSEKEAQTFNSLEQFEISEMPDLFGLTSGIWTHFSSKGVYRKTLMRLLCDTLDQMPNLKHLDLHAIGLEDEHVQLLINYLETRAKPLFTVNVSDNPSISLEKEKALEACVQHRREIGLLHGSLSCDDIPNVPDSVKAINAHYRQYVSLDKDDPHSNVDLVPVIQQTANNNLSEPAFWVYQSTLKKAPQTFVSKIMPNDHDCGFHALDTDRQTVQQVFLSLLNGDDPTKVAVLSQHLSTEVNEWVTKHTDLIPKRLKQIYDRLWAKQASIDQEKRIFYTQVKQLMNGSTMAYRGHPNLKPITESTDLKTYLMGLQDEIKNGKIHSSNTLQHDIDRDLYQLNYFDRQERQVEQQLQQRVYSDPDMVKIYVEQAFRSIKDDGDWLGLWSLHAYAALTDQHVSIYATQNKDDGLLNKDNTGQLSKSKRKQLRPSQQKLTYRHVHHTSVSGRLNRSHFNQLKKQKSSSISHVKLSTHVNPTDIEILCQSYAELYKLIFSVADAFIPRSLQDKSLQARMNSKEKESFTDLEILQIKAKKLQATLISSLPETIRSTKTTNDGKTIVYIADKHRTSFAQLESTYQQFLQTMLYGLTSENPTPLQQLHRSLSIAKRQFDIYLNLEPLKPESTIPEMAGFSDSQKTFFNQFVHQLSSLHTASASISAGVQAHSDKRFTLTEKAAHGLMKTMSIALSCAGPIGSGLKALGNVGSAAGDFLLNHEGTFETLAEGLEYTETILENKKVAHQVEKLEDSALQKLTGKRFLSTHTLLTNLSNSFNTTEDASREFKALAWAFIRRYEEQLELLTPKEATQWAELCANHVLEGLMFGFYNKRDLRFRLANVMEKDDKASFVQYALFWLAYIPMEEPINIGIGRCKYNLKGKQQFGSNNRTFNADALLKGPSLRCQDAEGNPIDFHLGDFEIKPSKKLNALLWRKRNFSHAVYDRSPYGYRLANQWEVDVLTGKNDGQFPWLDVASYQAKPKALSKPTHQQLGTARIKHLGLLQYQILNQHEAHQKLITEFKAFKIQCKKEINALNAKHTKQEKLLKETFTKNLQAEKKALQAEQQKVLNDLKQTHQKEMDKFQNKLIVQQKKIDELQAKNLKLENTVNQLLLTQHDMQKRLLTLERLTKPIKEEKESTRVTEINKDKVSIAAGNQGLFPIESTNNNQDHLLSEQQLRQKTDNDPNL